MQVLKSYSKVIAALFLAVMVVCCLAVRAQEPTESLDISPFSEGI